MPRPSLRSATIRIPSPVYFLINHRYNTFVQYYIIPIYYSFYSSIQQRSLTSDIVYPLYISAQDRFVSRHHRCTRSYFIWLGTFHPQPSWPHRYFRQQIYSTDIYERREEEVSSFEEETGFSTSEPRRIRKDFGVKRYEIFRFSFRHSLHSRKENLLIFVE